LFDSAELVALARSVEYFAFAECVDDLPGEIHVRACGIIVNVSRLSREWEGFVTLEISNTTHCGEDYAEMRPVPGAVF